MSKTKAQIAAEYGITVRTVNRRIREGKPAEGPSKKIKREKPTIEKPPKVGKTLSEIAKESGISKQAVWMRKKTGKSPEGPSRYGKVPRSCKRCGAVGHYAKTCKVPLPE